MIRAESQPPPRFAPNGEIPGSTRRRGFALSRAALNECAARESRKTFESWGRRGRDEGYNGAIRRDVQSQGAARGRSAAEPNTPTHPTQRDRNFDGLAPLSVKASDLLRVRGLDGFKAREINTVGNPDTRITGAIPCERMLASWHPTDE